MIYFVIFQGKCNTIESVGKDYAECILTQREIMNTQLFKEKDLNCNQLKN